jgi:hypothetical protein
MNIEKWLVHYRNMKGHFTNPTIFLVVKEILAIFCGIHIIKTLNLKGFVIKFLCDIIICM